MRFARLVLASVVLSLLPLTAFAQSTDTSSLSALLAEITALEQQISSISGSASTATTTSVGIASSPAATTGGMCPALERTLSLGSSGSDVVALQTFLAAKGFLQASATGYFGTLTQAAVSGWQEQNGVVSGGDASSTGLGVVGPKTRAAIAAECGSGSTQSSSVQCLPASPPQTDCPSSWQPVLDTKGCVMYYQCSVPLPGAATTNSSPSTTTISPTTTSCPVVAKPACSGTVQPFQTNASGCILSYQCTI